MKIHLSYLLVLLGLVAFVPAAHADVYVANPNQKSITVYAPDAVGNAAPARTIAGPATGLFHPLSVTVDEINDELYVADFQGRALHVFQLSANGNVAPLRTLIDGPNSGLAQVRMVAVDTVNNEIFVLCVDEAIRVYARTASGDAAPLRTIRGGNTMLYNAVSLVFDPVHNELITNSYDVGGPQVPGILVFDSTASDNVAPLRMIVGSNTLMGGYVNVTNLDAVNDEIFVEASGGAGVLVYPRTGNGNIPPVRHLTDITNGLTSVSGIAIDNANNRLVVTERSRNQVRAYPLNADGETPPLLVIGGPSTGLAKPRGPAIDAAGGLTGVGGIAVAATSVPAMTSWTVGALVLLLLLLATVSLRRVKEPGGTLPGR